MLGLFTRPSRFSEVAIKCDNILTLLHGNQKDSAIYLGEIKAAVPKLSPFSVSGIAKDGDIIVPPWGSTEDWNLIVAPNDLRFQKNGIKPSPEYSLISASITFETLEQKG